jgi:hypothetical protein
MTVAHRVAIAVVLAVTAGCVGGSDPSPDRLPDGTTTTGRSEQADTEPWGAAAIAWWGALEEATAVGPEFIVPFLAPDLVWEDRIFEQVAVGDQEWLDVQLARSQGAVLATGARFLLSRDEVLGQFTVSVGELNDAPAAGPDDSRFRYIAAPYTYSRLRYLDRVTIGPEGVSNWVPAQSLVDCRAIAPWRCELDADDLVDRYAAWWSGSPGADADSLYATDAIIFDTLLGESISGVPAIERSAASTSWPSLGQVTIADRPGITGRAVYVAPSNPDWAGADEITFLIDVDDGSGCPGSMGVAVALEGDRIIWERRYHDVMDVRRCHEPDELRPGWWEQMEAPAPTHAEQTGTVSRGDQDVDVFNGTPELEDFLRWGFSRYEAAGLPLPRIDSITFLPTRALCAGARGLAQPTADGANITLCATPDEICLDTGCDQRTGRSKFLLLHEFAHPWLDEHADEATRAAFLEHVDLPRWADRDDPWSDRGMERAANTLAFAMLDEPITMLPEVDGTCDERDTGFRILTSADPITPCTS